MTFIERYKKEDRWYIKVIMMEIYHIDKKLKVPGWTIKQLAEEFHCSIGLCSENLQIAEKMHTDSELINCKNRAEALKRINNYDLD
jgi:hypothetical protein